MKLKTSVSLMIAIVLGLITMKVGLDLMKNYRGSAQLTSRVIVAKKPMSPGHVIKLEDVEMQQVAVNLVPPKALHEPEEVVGRTIVALVVPGQTMLEVMMTPKGAGSGLAAIVPPGMRAVTVDVSDSSAVAGMLVSGSKVDVIATLRKGEQTIAKAVVENVTVQSIQRGITGYSSKGGQTTAIESGPVKTVTLLVTPKQASALELANQGGGRPRLVLRGDGDVASNDGTMSDRELAGIPDDPPAPEPVTKPKEDDTFANVPPPPEDKGRPVEIIRGGAASTIYINESKKEEPSGGTTPTARVNSNSAESAKGTQPAE